MIRSSFHDAPWFERASAAAWPRPQRLIEDARYDYGTRQPAVPEHSASSGLSQGNQKGTGLREKHGAGISTDRHVPGRQMEAFPNVTHGRMWNSVLIMVGHMGTSNGTGMGPTDSGGMGRSGRQSLGLQESLKQ